MYIWSVDHFELKSKLGMEVNSPFISEFLAFVPLPALSLYKRFYLILDKFILDIFFYLGLDKNKLTKCATLEKQLPGHDLQISETLNFGSELQMIMKCHQKHNDKG